MEVGLDVRVWGFGFEITNRQPPTSSDRADLDHAAADEGFMRSHTRYFYPTVLLHLVLIFYVVAGGPRRSFSQEFKEECASPPFLDKEKVAQPGIQSTVLHNACMDHVGRDLRCEC